MPSSDIQEYIKAEHNKKSRHADSNLRVLPSLGTTEHTYLGSDLDLLYNQARWSISQVISMVAVWRRDPSVTHTS